MKKDTYIGREEKTGTKKILGNRVNLDELDNILNKRYKRNEFTCNIVKNKIVINTNCENNKEVIDYASEITKFNKKTFVINRVEKLPRKENGKINYSVLLRENINRNFKG